MKRDIRGGGMESGRGHQGFGKGNAKEHQGWGMGTRRGHQVFERKMRRDIRRGDGDEKRTSGVRDGKCKGT